MFSDNLLREFGWFDAHLIDLAREAAEGLARAGLGREAVLIWLDGVCAEPQKYLSDPQLGALAWACLWCAVDRDGACPV